MNYEIKEIQRQDADLQINVVVKFYDEEATFERVSVLIIPEEQLGQADEAFIINKILLEQERFEKLLQIEKLAKSIK